MNQDVVWMKQKTTNKMSISNFESFSVNEASDYEFNPNEAARRLKEREEENIQRFRAAQEREDNYAIEYYKYRIQLDKIDLERLKVQTKIHQLKQKKK
jgi:hypothetical protein